MAQPVYLSATNFDSLLSLHVSSLQNLHLLTASPALPLQNLTFGGSFNQPIGNVTLPSSLQNLRFGEDFNQPIEQVAWPSSLQTLIFGFSFNQPMEMVALPSSLHNLTFGEDFNRSIHTITLPSGLKSLVLGGAKYQWNGEQWTMDAGQDDATCLPAGFIQRL